MEALEAVLEQVRRDGKAKEARHRLTVERLRRQIVELQVRWAPALSCSQAYYTKQAIEIYSLIVHTMKD